MSVAQAEEQIVYSVYSGLNLGNVGELPRKDYYVNVGTSQGISVGNTLEVIRRMPTYDLVSEKLYRDVAFPIAHLKVIHVEATASIARLEKFFPADKTPTILPRAVMVGDFVRKVR